MREFEEYVNQSKVTLVVEGENADNDKL